MALGSGMMFLECIQGLFLDGGIWGDLLFFYLYKNNNMIFILFFSEESKLYLFFGYTGIKFYLIWYDMSGPYQNLV